MLYPGYFSNGLETNATALFKNSVTKTASRNISQSNRFQVGYSVGFKLSGELLVFKTEHSLTLSFDYTHVETTEKSEETSAIVGWDLTNIVLPGRTIYCKASVEEGRYTAKYTSYFILTLDTGYSFSFTSRGEVENVGYSQANVTCVPMERSTVPADAPQLPML